MCARMVEKRRLVVWSFLFVFLLGSSFLVHADSLVTLYNQSFSSACDWTGGTCDVSNRQYNVSGNFSFIDSPGLNLSNFTYFVISQKARFSSWENFWKASPLENTDGTIANDHILEIVSSATQMLFENEPGYNVSCSPWPSGQWLSLRYEYNRTNSTLAKVNFTVSNSTASCSIAVPLVVNWSFNSGLNSYEISPGSTNGSSPTFATTNITVQVFSGEYNNSFLAPTGTLNVQWLTTQNGTISFGGNTTMTYNVTCTGGSCTNVLVYHDPIYPGSPTSMCGSTYTCQALIDLWVSDLFRDSVDENINPVTKMAAVRWYTTEGTCTTGGVNSQGSGCQDQLNSGTGSCSTLNVANHQFCVVTDEQGEGQLMAALGSNQSKYEELHRFTMTLVMNSGTANQLLCWKAYVNGQSNYAQGGGQCAVTDSASDAELRILGAMELACAKQLAGTWVIGGGFTNYCTDMDTIGKRVFGQGTTQHGDVAYLSSGAWLAGGYNTAGLSPTDTYSLYPDYFELWALEFYAEYQNNATLLQYVQDLGSQFYRSTLASPNSTYGIAYGANINATNNTGVTLQCSRDSFGNTTSGPNCAASDNHVYTDNTDRFRQFLAMGAYYSTRPQKINSTLNSSVFSPWQTYLLNKYNPTSDALPFEVYANSSRGIKSSENSYKTLGTWLPLAVGSNSTWALAAVNRLANTLYTNTGNNGKFSGAAYYGAYYSTFPARAVALYAGLLDPLNLYSGWTNSSGTGPSTTKGVSPVGAGSPFWVTQANPQSCGNMTNGSSCSVTWTVWANGTVGASYTIFAFTASTNSMVAQSANGNWTIGAAVVNGTNDTWTLASLRDVNGNLVSSFDLNITPDSIALTNVVPPRNFTNDATNWTATIAKAGWYAHVYNFTTTPLAHTSVTLTNVANAYLQFFDQNNNSVTPSCTINGGALTFVNTYYTAVPEGNFTLICAQGTNYSAYTQSFTKLTNATFNQTILLSGYTLGVTIRSEDNGLAILQNVTVELTGNTTLVTQTTGSGMMNFTGLQNGQYTLRVTSALYSTRSYVVNINNAANAITIYLTNSSSQVVFTMIDQETGAIIEGVQLDMYRVINDSLVIVESHFSDVTGKTLFTYTPDVKYTFIGTKNRYAVKTFTLDPILFNSYDVRMQQSTTDNQEIDYTGVVVYYTPQQFSENVTNNLSFILSSPQSILTSYNISITYPGGSINLSGTSPTGETFLYNFTIINATSTDCVNISYAYTTSNGISTYAYCLPIYTTPQSGTIFGLLSQDYGLGQFEKTFLGVIFIIIVGGVATLFMGTLVGGTIGLLFMGVLTYAGLIPLWAMLISGLVGFILIGRRSGE